MLPQASSDLFLVMKTQWVMPLGAPCVHSLRALFLIAHIQKPVLPKGLTATKA